MYMRILSVFILGYIIAPTYSQPEKAKKPLVSIDFEAEGTLEEFYTFTGRDSIVEGINGEAKYFSGSPGNDNHILINQNETLSSLWKDQDFSIEV